MSNRTFTNAVQTALDLCRDAYGNGVSGQEERSLRYTALAVEQLRAIIQVLESKGDTRKTVELERLTKSVRNDTHPSYADFPPMDGANATASLGKWSARNMPSNVLRAMNIDSLPPEMQAALANGKEQGRAVTVSLTREQAGGVFEFKS